MPLLLVSELKDVGSYPKVELPHGLRNRYPTVFKLLDNRHDVKLRVYLNRFYNKEGGVVKEYKELFILPLEKIFF
ncbi:MAG: hypothetical protein QXP97_07590 [Desulfurococcus sp.]|uniref:hypothetical protein n=1 Tax=Desulfurococcus sp. TaxID=51678 RepID=UPI00316918AA